MTNRRIGYFEADGSYNEREYKPYKRQPQMYDDVVLDFTKPLSSQIEGQVSAKDAETLDKIRDSYELMLIHGMYPGKWEFRMQRQIRNKVIRCMADYRKQLIRDFEP